MEKLRPEDKFAPRVQVLSTEGVHIYTVHAEEASRMVRDGNAKRCGNGRRVRAVELLQAIAEHCIPGAPPSLRQYMGQKYTYTEAVRQGGVVVARVVQFKKIDPRDRPLFMLSVTDCLSPKAAV